MFIYLNWKNYRCNSMVPNDKLGPIGKPVKFRCGPAAVIGNEPRIEPLIRLQTDREGAGSRKIRKSEDLPLKFTFEVMANPQASDIAWGFLFLGELIKGFDYASSDSDGSR